MYLKNKLYFALVFMLTLCGMFPLQAEELAGDELALNLAREHLSEKNLPKSLQSYREIAFGSLIWKDKIEDFIRYQLLKKNYQEAWRLTQLARKTSQSIADLDYYEALSVSLYGVCPFTYALNNSANQHLLYAYAYRYFSRFFPDGEKEDPYLLAADGRQLTYLDKSRLHSLTSIPKARLQTKVGCRFLKPRLETRETAQVQEYNQLQNYWKIRHSLDDTVLSASTSVFVRFLVLSEKLKHVEQSTYILDDFLNMPVELWLNMSETERLFIWQKLIDTQRVVFPLPIQDPKAELVKSILKRAQDRDSSYWLSAVKFEDWSVKDKQEIVAHLLLVEDIKFRSELLLLNAFYDYVQGRISACLSGIRKLLLDEGYSDEKTLEKALELSLMIFSEYQYDDKILGALEASLPSSVWSRVYARLLIDHALRGDQKGFSRLIQKQQKTHKSMLRSKFYDLDFYTTVLHRNYPGFTQQWQSRLKANGVLNSQGMKIIKSMSECVLNLSAQERSAIKGFLLKIAQILEHSSKLDRVQTGEKKSEWFTYISIFDPEFSTDYRRGMSEVMKGSTPVGTVDLRHSLDLSQLLTWKKVTFVPLRDLIMYPQSVGGREWVLR